MFCPNCKLEYRRGFTECSDCRVPLVESLEAAHTNALRDPDALEVLWSGQERRIFDAIISTLRAENIDFEKKAQEVGLIPGLVPGAASRVFTVITRGCDHDAAHAALDAAMRELNGLAQDASIADDGTTSDQNTAMADDADESDKVTLDEDDSLPGPEYTPEDFYADEATAEVWSGADVETEEMLVACLHENGIGCVVDDASEPVKICVMPSAEARAKQIVREVVEATPPE